MDSLRKLANSFKQTSSAGLEILLRNIGEAFTRLLSDWKLRLNCITNSRHHPTAII